MAQAGWRIRSTAGEILFTVESDKAIQEVEALESGILRIPPDSPLGVQVSGGHTPGLLLLPGEALPAAIAAPAAPDRAKTASEMLQASPAAKQ